MDRIKRYGSVLRQVFTRVDELPAPEIIGSLKILRS